jgi:beta-lactam-binding protein with PASTA domain
MPLKEFFKSKIFLKHFGLAVLFTFVLIWITMIMLSFYTNKGESFPTPELKGLSIGQVENLSNKNDFRFEIEDSVFRKGVQPGTIVFQNPEAGHKIKPNRLIYLTLASVLPEQVEVPKLTDVSIRQARVLLDSKGFALGSVEFKPSEFDDLVLEQKYKGRTIEPGTKLGNGETIDLVVGKNLAGGETMIPDLTGYTFPIAREILKSKSLSIGSAVYDPSVISKEDTLNAVIWKQLPLPDSTNFVKPGISVDIWLQLKQATPETEK